MKSVNTIVCCFAATVCAWSADAVPELSDVMLYQGNGRTVKFSYVLSGESAVVTARFIDATTGDYLPDDQVKTFVGAVNRVVHPSATPKEGAWKAGKDCPGRFFDVRLELTAWSEAEPPLYMDVDLATGETTYHCTTNSLPAPIGSDAAKTTHLVLRRIPQTAPTGFFLGDNANPSTCATVHVTRPFYLAIYEFTQGQTHTVFGDTWLPAKLSEVSTMDPDWLGDKKPVTGWENYRLRGYGLWPTNDTAGLTPVGSHGLVSRMRELTGLAFNLPTEAQWEYACRAGSTGKYPWGDSASPAVAAKYAFVNLGTAAAHPQEIGLLEPNAWGLYDMIGNVGEMTLTYYVDAYWTATDYVDPRGPDETTMRSYVSRGYGYSGWWAATTCFGRSSTDGASVSMGFRLCCNPTPWEDVVEVP